MAGPDRSAAISVDTVPPTPEQCELMQALRTLQRTLSPQVRFSEATGPHDEPVRAQFSPSPSFAGTNLTSAAPHPETTADNKPTFQVRGFGLLDANGPLPGADVEALRERATHGRDPAALHFLDLLQRRLLYLFFEAWADARPSVQSDNPGRDRFADYVGSLFGLHAEARGRDAFPDVMRLYFAGRLGPKTRSPESLATIVSESFGLPVEVIPYSLGWLKLHPQDRTRLGENCEAAMLGGSATLGERVQDRQSHFRLRIGPIAWADFERLLPDGDRHAALADCVTAFTGGELIWDLQLLLTPESARPTRLGQIGRLGRDSWLGTRSGSAALTDAVITPRPSR